MTQDQIVKVGDLSLQIDKRDYELAVQKAEAELEKVIAHLTEGG